MSNLIKIAVDAMGGDGSPKKIVEGIIHNHKSNNENFYRIFGDENEINKFINKKIDKNFYEINNKIVSEETILPTGTIGSLQKVILTKFQDSSFSVVNVPLVEVKVIKCLNACFPASKLLKKRKKLKVE